MRKSGIWDTLLKMVLSVQMRRLGVDYTNGGAVRPMLPDLLVIRKDGKSFSFDILEPHDPTRADNAAKAVGLAQFAEKHGHLFGHIELIRKHQVGGKGSYLRLDFNNLAIRRDTARVTMPAQLDGVFAQHAKAR